MIPWTTVDRAATPDGTPLSLSRRGEEYVIRAGGHALMGSRAHGSEDALGARGVAHLGSTPKARVLIGGLGMGFTLRAALDALRADSTVTVAELVPAVLRWNREHLGHLAGRPLDDPRVSAVESDVGAVMANGGWDAVLLDVDNGPSAITDQGNARLYGDAGVARMARALRPGGALAVWSAGDDRAFEKRLRDKGFDVSTERARARGGGGGWHVLWVARLVV